MKTILLKLSGPLQAWGTNSHFETRSTDRYPSKSAVIGMIAGALGYRRDEDEKLKQLRKLSFAVRIDQPGNILSDFQIATMNKPNGDFNRTYVTKRYYLQDAKFVVSIGSDNNKLMNKIYHGLCNPYFQPYLGRRSVPVNADYIVGIYDDTVINKLKCLKWQAPYWYQRKHSNKLDIWADSNLVNNKYYQMNKDIPDSFAQGKTNSEFNHLDRRTYRFRAIGHLSINALSDIK